MRIDPFRRWAEKLVLSNGCWLWTGGNNGRYGRFWTGERHVQAHRWGVENIRGLAFAVDQVADHLCRTTLCVNPWHIEPVTQSVNVRRGTSSAAEKARRKHCPRGHGYSVITRGKQAGERLCRVCKRERDRGRER